MPLGRLHHLIVDCPDPMAEARFWSAVLGDPITYADDDFTVVSASTAASGLAFQRAPGWCRRRGRIRRCRSRCTST